MKVYLCSATTWRGHCLLGIYSTLDKANKLKQEYDIARLYEIKAANSHNEKYKNDEYILKEWDEDFVRIEEWEME